ncbi:hypothetical protein HX017_06610 [Myroides marinus]|uniref:ligand-binding sensor domain-containing protein n=1 Tax=Myroides marinus TaxID=703342 RepID=UPI0025763340|nr:two-component regulator propeller domain-containing protein [Myroides marinus]MDM1364619.1 hypothetical protein [Myroides marinus]MDM1377931.1 hypothetical protein [Myroides marinus]MDM1385202.1 hypothetical protein [Myroides marinus]MDM1392415.1 hypothetical protein [Myroides marinus]MDM1532636.1 hypothetical protein [Myroides marinus]
MKYIYLLSIFFLTTSVSAQYLLPVKVENCIIDKFCLDCGDKRAGYKEKDFSKLLKALNTELHLEGLEGKIMFQVLVAPNGTGCVISHTDESKNQITNTIIEHLNNFTKWTPSVTDGKKELKTSINVLFTISNNKIDGSIERVDFEKFEESFDHPTDPEITNKDYQYSNVNLPNYKIEVWNTKNSSLIKNNVSHIDIDSHDKVWTLSDTKLQVFNGENFELNEYIDLKNNNKSGFYEISINQIDEVWVYGNGMLYTINNGVWNRQDKVLPKDANVYKIDTNPNSAEVFIGSNKGLVIYKDNDYRIIDQNKIKELPSNRAYFAHRDSKGRLWIGTFGGSALIDNDNKLTNFEKSDSILKGKCITSMTEDVNGNIFFTVFEFDFRNKKADSAGLFVLLPDGTLKELTIKNSGLPINFIEEVLYEKNEQILWISTRNAGLIRYDLINDTWENYHNKNSNLPSSRILDMKFDSKNNLFLATDQGLVKISKE